MARKAVTVSLPSDLVREAGRYCRSRSATLSEVTREALRGYLRQEELRSARESFSRHVVRRGIGTEKDLINFILS